MRIPLVAALILTACVTTAPMQQPAPRFVATELELTVKDVDAELVQQLQAQFAKNNDLRSAQLKSHSGKTAVFTVMYPGDVGDLPRTLATIPRPASSSSRPGTSTSTPPSTTCRRPSPSSTRSPSRC